MKRKKKKRSKTFSQQPLGTGGGGMESVRKNKEGRRKKKFVEKNCLHQAAEARGID